VAVEEGVRPGDVPGVEDLAHQPVARFEDGRPDDGTQPVARDVARDRGTGQHQCRDDQRRHRAAEADAAERGEHPDGEQQRVAGQDREEAALGEDDQRAAPERPVAHRVDEELGVHPGG